MVTGEDLSMIAGDQPCWRESLKRASARLAAIEILRARRTRDWQRRVALTFTRWSRIGSPWRSGQPGDALAWCTNTVERRNAARPHRQLRLAYAVRGASTAETTTTPPPRDPRRPRLAGNDRRERRVGRSFASGQGASLGLSLLLRSSTPLLVSRDPSFSHPPSARGVRHCPDGAEVHESVTKPSELVTASEQQSRPVAISAFFSRKRRNTGLISTTSWYARALSLSSSSSSSLSSLSSSSLSSSSLSLSLSSSLRRRSGAQRYAGRYNGGGVRRADRLTARRHVRCRGDRVLFPCRSRASIRLLLQKLRYCSFDDSLKDTIAAEWFLR